LKPSEQLQRLEAERLEIDAKAADKEAAAALLQLSQQHPK
jgi:hypothetical protein